MNIIEGKPQPAPLDRVELSPADVFAALRAYILTHSGRTAHEIVGRNLTTDGISFACSFTLSLKPESK